MSSPDRVQSVLRRFTRRDPDPAGVVTAIRETPARPARFGEWPAEVPIRLVEALRSRGIAAPWSHQAAAIGHVLAGRNVVVETPTASGKTLCYNVPVVARILRDPGARALYMFPTKALAQDQMNELQQLVDALGEPIKTFTYDGDTPDDARRAIRAQGHVVVTNPDMLHQGILPHHAKWAKLFQNLRYVVIDELHTYRGIFGSHVCNLVRRLKRVCRFHGSNPVFITCSATIANPRELAEKLIEAPVEHVNDNGAPSGGKTFVLVNPPIVNRELGIRRSCLATARRIASDFLRADVSTIVFATSRLNVEVLTRYLKEDHERGPVPEGRIRSYRGGYLPNTRREIERGLRDGHIRGVVSTNALELGIDIGSLDACVIAGYPGSIASVWQQAGRAGRCSDSSAAVFVARSEPIDQFLVTHPEYFFGKSPEHGLINPDNLLVLVAHVKCAAFEMPFEKGERFGGEDLGELLRYLEEEKILKRVGDRWHWTREVYPADGVDLRSAGNENFVIMDETDANRVIAEVNYESAPSTIHEEAIYLCESQVYHVRKLDYEQRRAYVKKVETDYFTEAITNTSVRVLDVFEGRRAEAAVPVEHGEVHVAWRVSGFKKLKFHTRENVGFGDVNLPDQKMNTTAYWFQLPLALLHGEGRTWTRADLLDGAMGVAYLLHHIAPLILLCDVRDLARCVGDRSAEWFAPADRESRAGFGRSTVVDGSGAEVALEALERFDPVVFLYDKVPGGIGLSTQLYDSHDFLIARATELLESCSCAHGCPSCVGPINESGARSKEIARELLDAMLASVAASAPPTAPAATAEAGAPS